jgi:uncharacterized protein (UPF0333 family)
MAKLTNPNSSPSKKKSKKSRRSIGSSSKQTADDHKLTVLNLDNEQNDLEAGDDLDFVTTKRKVSASLITESAEMEIPHEDISDELKKQITQTNKQLQIIKKDLTPILYVRDVPSDEFHLIL